MSRTFKDKPSRLLWGDYSQDYIYCEGYSHRLGKTTKPKVKRTVDTEWAWMQATPSWWNREFHTKPIRNKFRTFSINVIKSSIEEVECMLEPTDSHKPHKYYW